MSTLRKLRSDRARQTSGLVAKRLRQRRDAVARLAPELRDPLLYVDLSLSPRILRSVPRAATMTAFTSTMLAALRDAIDEELR